MKRLLLALLIVVASLAGMTSAASAAGQICHDVEVRVNGEALVDDAACTPLP